MVGRILVGVGIGVSSGVVPLYISEVILRTICTNQEEQSHSLSHSKEVCSV